jgi:hypothetical protein
MKKDRWFSICILAGFSLNFQAIAQVPPLEALRNPVEVPNQPKTFFLTFNQVTGKEITYFAKKEIMGLGHAVCTGEGNSELCWGESLPRTFESLEDAQDECAMLGARVPEAAEFARFARENGGTHAFPQGPLELRENPGYSLQAPHTMQGRNEIFWSATSRKIHKRRFSRIMVMGFRATQGILVNVDCNRARAICVIGTHSQIPN